MFSNVTRLIASGGPDHLNCLAITMIEGTALADYDGKLHPTYLSTSASYVYLANKLIVLGMVLLPKIPRNTVRLGLFANLDNRRVDDAHRWMSQQSVR